MIVRRKVWKVLMLLSVSIVFHIPLSSFNSAHAQIRKTDISTSRDFGKFRSTSGLSTQQNNQNRSLTTSTDSSQTDTSATKGLVYVKETPDSVLRKKVFFFHHTPLSVKIDELWNPTLDPTGAQFNDPLDGFNGDFFLGQGTIGHPHWSIIPKVADGLVYNLQSDGNDGYLKTPGNIRFYQTMTPYTVLSYNNSLYCAVVQQLSEKRLLGASGTHAEHHPGMERFVRLPTHLPRGKSFRFRCQKPLPRCHHQLFLPRLSFASTGRLHLAIDDHRRERRFEQ